MKYTTLLPFVATATAIVIPDHATAEQLALETGQTAEKTASSWWDSLDNLRSSAEDSFASAVETLDHHAHKLSDLLPLVEIESELSGFLSPSDYSSTADDNNNNNGHVGKPGHHGTTNLTVYQAIQASNFTRKFAALVDEYPDIVDTLNSTEANVTAFVPVDKAFEKIPDHHKKPPREFVEKLLAYHIVPGYYPAGRVLAHHTLPTALKAPELGDRPQRLRFSVGLFGVRVNFYSKVIMVNLFCKNGITHGVDSILVPPPPAERLISLFPTKFSTLELAAEKTGLKHHHRRHHHSDDGEDKTKLAAETGLTIFAPTNLAFRKLGPGANAFLFNTEKGLGYLKALLKYHFVVNETLYSDAYYGKGSEHDVEDEGLLLGDDHDHDTEAENNNGGGKRYHVDLPTLLDDKSIAVDISRWYGFITMKVNGYVRVATQDGVAKDGVVQVVNTVLIPPHEHKGFWDEEKDAEISPEELMERLEPYVEREGQQKEKEKAEAWGEL